MQLKKDHLYISGFLTMSIGIIITSIYFSGIGNILKAQIIGRNDDSTCSYKIDFNPKMQNISAGDKAMTTLSLKSLCQNNADEVSIDIDGDIACATEKEKFSFTPGMTQETKVICKTTKDLQGVQDISVYVYSQQRAGAGIQEREGAFFTMFVE